MEQGHHIPVANSIAMLGFASKDNVLMKAISSGKDETDVSMDGNHSALCSLGEVDQ
jgi:hypothetical protein